MCVGSRQNWPNYWSNYWSLWGTEAGVSYTDIFGGVTLKNTVWSEVTLAELEVQLCVIFSSYRGGKLSDSSLGKGSFSSYLFLYPPVSVLIISLDTLKWVSTLVCRWDFCWFYNSMIFVFWPFCAACGILVPQPGMEHMPPSPTHASCSGSMES